MKRSTDYDSLNARDFFLWEQMLLQPFKVIVGPMNVVLPRPSQLQRKRHRGRLHMPVLWPIYCLTLIWDFIFCSRWHFFSPFQTLSGRWAYPHLSGPPWPSRYGRGRSEKSPLLLLLPGIKPSSVHLANPSYFTLCAVETDHMTLTSLLKCKLTIIFRLFLNPKQSFIWLSVSLKLFLSGFYFFLKKKWCGAPKILCLPLALLHLCSGCWACTGYPLGQSAHSSWSNTVPDLKCWHMKKTMSNC